MSTRLTGSQGQILTVTALCVPYSLDCCQASGLRVQGILGEDEHESQGLLPESQGRDCFMCAIFARLFLGLGVKGILGEDELLAGRVLVGHKHGPPALFRRHCPCPRLKRGIYSNRVAQ